MLAVECAAALVQDIHERGLDRKFMVALMGDFGRATSVAILGP